MAGEDRRLEGLYTLSAGKQDSLLRTRDCSWKSHVSFCKSLVGGGVRRRGRFDFPSEKPQARDSVTATTDRLVWRANPYYIQGVCLGGPSRGPGSGGWTTAGLGLPESAHTYLYSCSRRAPSLGLGSQRVSGGRWHGFNRQ